ncbi:hypothetical protein ACLOJK_024354 [Asimina triloba]
MPAPCSCRLQHVVNIGSAVDDRRFTLKAAAKATVPATTVPSQNFYKQSIRAEANIIRVSEFCSTWTGTLSPMTGVLFMVDRNAVNGKGSLSLEIGVYVPTTASSPSPPHPSQQPLAGKLVILLVAAHRNSALPLSRWISLIFHHIPNQSLLVQICLRLPALEASTSHHNAITDTDKDHLTIAPHPEEPKSICLHRLGIHFPIEAEKALCKSSW